MDRYRVTSREPIELGRAGENKAREIVFDISRWRKIYGDGEVRLMARRAGEEVMYQVDLTQDGDDVVWTVTDTDAAITGGGECELSYVCADGTIAKSVTYGTFVQPSMQWETFAPPLAAEPWLNEVRALAKEMREALGYLWNGSASADDAAYWVEFGTLEYNSAHDEELSFNFSQSYTNAPVFIPYVDNENLRVKVEALSTKAGYYGGKVTVVNLRGESIAATVAISAYCSLPSGVA